MTQREELAAALDDVDRRLGMGRGFGLSSKQPPMEWVLAAARERLAQLPEKCETCGGKGFYADGDRVSCSTCHGNGVLYPPALVKRIAAALEERSSLVGLSKGIAVAVLDALNSEPATIS